MSDIFMMIGMMVIFALAGGVITWVLGWACGDGGDCTLRWLISCILYSIVLTFVVNYCV